MLWHHVSNNTLWISLPIRIEQSVESIEILRQSYYYYWFSDISKIIIGVQVNNKSKFLKRFILALESIKNYDELVINQWPCNANNNT